MMAKNQTKSYCNGLKEKEFWVSRQVLFFQNMKLNYILSFYLQIKPVEGKIKMSQDFHSFLKSPE